MTSLKSLKILIIDDDINLCASLETFLSKQGHHVKTCHSGEEGLDILHKEIVQVVLLDMMLPGMNGLETLKKIMEYNPSISVLMMSGEADVEMAVEATKIGAYHFYEKPLNPDQILLECRHLSERIYMQKKLKHLEESLSSGDIIGESQSIIQLKNTIRKTAPTDSRVLILGENGSGKELVAQALHRQSLRAGKPFVSLNCAAIPKDLVESELFGHEKGAFTGAHQSKTGRFEEAEGGTLFLDEIGDMSLDTQAKLLRVLESREAIRVGGTKAYSFNVRVIAATNKIIEDEIRDGRFREDLYYRLNVLTITVPALKDRVSDISLLADAFLTQLCQQSGRGQKAFDASAYAALQKHSWPGNVRELRNFVERLFIMTDSDVIGEKDIQLLMTGKIHPDGTMFEIDESLSYRDQVQQFESYYLTCIFKELDGNISRMAEKLQIDRANLHRKLKSLGIK